MSATVHQLPVERATGTESIVDLKDAPYGYCQCGCGEKTTVYYGTPRTFIHGHATRKRWTFKEQDRGHATPCWIWQASRAGGYGQVAVVVDGRRTTRRAHRLIYEQLVGPVPVGLYLDHLCRVRECVNPDHLEPVTHRENILRGATLPAANAAKTHCLNGHPFDEENTYWHGHKRRCRACNRAAARKRRSKRKAA